MSQHQTLCLHVTSVTSPTAAIATTVAIVTATAAIITITTAVISAVTVSDTATTDAILINASSIVSVTHSYTAALVTDDDDNDDDYSSKTMRMMTTMRGRYRRRSYCYARAKQTTAGNDVSSRSVPINFVL